MKHLTKYSAKSLYGFFKTEEICFVIEQSYEFIDETSDVTDDLKKAKKIAEENDAQIFIYKKKINYVDDFLPRKDCNSWYADECIGVLKI